LVFHIEGGTYSERVREEGAAEDVWPNRDEVIGDWRRLHDEERNDLYCSTKYYSGDKINKNELGGLCGTNG